MGTSGGAWSPEHWGLTSGSIATRFCRITTLLVFTALVLAIVSNHINLLRNGHLGHPYPMTFYEVLTIPGTAADGRSPGASGADFSQVYQAGLALRHGQSGYHPTNPAYRDYFGRPSGYPPLTNWVFVPLSWLPYPVALVTHTALSFLGFLAASAWLLYKTGLSRHIWRVVLLTGSFYVLTPVGVAHLERGQFDWLVATAVVLCSSCWFVAGNRFGAAALSGLLGALKWTAAPFVGSFAALGFLLASRAKRWVFFLIPLVWGLGTVPFWSEMKGYWEAVDFYELTSEPMGLSFEAYLPRLWVKVLPLLVAGCLGIVVLVRSRSPAARARIFGATSVPFAIALTNIGVGYSAESFEYHTVTTLAMVPLLVVWLERERWVSNRLKAFISAAFALFLLVVFRTYGPGHYVNVFILDALYALSAILFFGLSLGIALMVPPFLPGDLNTDATDARSAGGELGAPA